MVATNNMAIKQLITRTGLGTLATKHAYTSGGMYSMVPTWLHVIGLSLPVVAADNAVPTLLLEPRFAIPVLVGMDVDSDSLLEVEAVLLLGELVTGMGAGVLMPKSQMRT